MPVNARIVRQSQALPMPNSPPVIANPDTVVAAAGTGPIALGIAAPTDPENDTLTITLDAVPVYGTVEYFNGSAWTPVGARDRS